MLKQDVRCSKREYRWHWLPDHYQRVPDALGCCECPAMMIEMDVFTGQCLNFEEKEMQS